MRRSHQDLQDWAPRLTGQSVVVVCQQGSETQRGYRRLAPQSGKSTARRSRRRPRRLDAGANADRSRRQDPQARRARPHRLGHASRPKIDRIACPWLIRRFIDPTAVFLFVAAVRSRSRRPSGSTQRRSTSKMCSGAIAANSAPSMSWSRNSASRRRRWNGWRRWSAPPIPRGSISRRKRPACSPPRSASRACSTTTSSSWTPACLLYDAFYRWCRDATDETHNWPTNKVKP